MLCEQHLCRAPCAVAPGFLKKNHVPDTISWAFSGKDSLQHQRFSLHLLPSFPQTFPLESLHLTQDCPALCSFSPQNTITASLAFLQNSSFFLHFHLLQSLSPNRQPENPFIVCQHFHKMAQSPWPFQGSPRVCVSWKMSFSLCSVFLEGPSASLAPCPCQGPGALQPSLSIAGAGEK